MKHSTFTSIFTTLCFVILISFTAYSRTRDKADLTNSKLQAIKPADKYVITADTLDRKLYVLYIETDSLKGKLINKKRLLFNYFVDASNALTLHGWIVDKGWPNYGNKFVQDTEIVLEKTSLYNGIIDKGTYLGNVVIGRKNLKKILKKIKDSKSTLKYLVFAPEKTDGHIQYKLNLYEKLPTTINLNIFGGDLTANPTPPRQYDGFEN